jgi:hypothetical protein
MNGQFRDRQHWVQNTERRQTKTKRTVQKGKSTVQKGKKMSNTDCTIVRATGMTIGIY